MKIPQVFDQIRQRRKDVVLLDVLFSRVKLDLHLVDPLRKSIGDPISDGHEFGSLDVDFQKRNFFAFISHHRNRVLQSVLRSAQALL